MKKVSYQGVSIQNDPASRGFKVRQVLNAKDLEEAVYFDIEPALLDIMEKLYRKGWNSAVKMMKNRVEKMEVKE